MDRITLIRPDDWHLHLRDGPQMASVLADSAQRFARAIVMPNLKSPVRTTHEALPTAAASSPRCPRRRSSSR